MAKYSTGEGGGGGDGDACELCGEASDRLREAQVAGAQLLVCQDCAPHDDAAKRSGASGSGGGGGGGGGSGQGRSQDDRSGPSTGTETSELWDSDTSDWEREGTDYESDPLPYLATDYGTTVTEARQEEGLQIGELAEELGVPEDDLLAIEQGRAARAGIGGSLVEALEERLGVDLVED